MCSLFPLLQIFNGEFMEGYGLWAVLRYSEGEGEEGEEVGEWEGEGRAKEVDLSGRRMTELKREVGGGKGEGVGKGGEG